MDLVFFAGPVQLKPSFQRIDWLGSAVRIVPIPGEGSSHFASLAESLRGADGRILPNLIARYAPGIPVDRVALAAYSAGHGLLNKIADVDADRERVSAMILSDACFSGFTDPPKRGYVKFAVDAARGKRLLVSTTANTSDGSYRTGRDSYALVWDEAMKLTGLSALPINPRVGVPPASGGWWRMGAQSFWGNYALGGSSDITHVEHHDLAPIIWQAYLAPYWSGAPLWVWAAGGVIAAVGAAALIRG